MAGRGRRATGLAPARGAWRGGVRGGQAKPRRASPRPGAQTSAPARPLPPRVPRRRSGEARADAPASGAGEGIPGRPAGCLRRHGGSGVTRSQCREKKGPRVTQDAVFVLLL